MPKPSISLDLNQHFSGAPFLGFFLFQVPGAAYARRKSTRWLVAVALVSWGTLASLTGVITNFRLLATDRLLLGVAESFILPAMLVLLTNWFVQTEGSRANTILLTGNPVTVLWMSAITGYLIRDWGWQKAFIAEGVPSILWGFIWLAIVRDKPERASWIGARRLHPSAARTGTRTADVTEVSNVFAAIRNGKVICICIQYFFWSVGVYGFVLWLPTMVQQGMKQGIAITGLLSAAPYLLAVIAMLLVSHFSDLCGRRMQFIWPSLLMGGAALMVRISQLRRTSGGPTSFSFLRASECTHPTAPSSRSSPRYFRRTLRAK